MRQNVSPGGHLVDTILAELGMCYAQKGVKLRNKEKILILETTELVCRIFNEAIERIGLENDLNLTEKAMMKKRIFDVVSGEKV